MALGKSACFDTHTHDSGASAAFDKHRTEDHVSHTVGDAQQEAHDANETEELRGG